MSWLAALLAQVATKVALQLFTKAMEWFHKDKQQDAASDDKDAAIDARLARLKTAYQKQFDGTPVTPEQRTEMHNALSDFIRGGTAGGL